MIFFPLIWRRHNYRWRDAKFKPICKLGAQDLWAERNLYRATPAVIRGFGFSRLIRRIAPFSRLLRHTRACGGSILTESLWSASSRLLRHAGGWLEPILARILMGQPESDNTHLEQQYMATIHTWSNNTYLNTVRARWIFHGVLRILCNKKCH
jgi:hypothetical protein